jgi:hypothetical protein
LSSSVLTKTCLRADLHGQHHNVLVESCHVHDAGDDSFAIWSVGTGASNITFRNNTAIYDTTLVDRKSRCGLHYCYAVFGGQAATFHNNVGTGCGYNGVSV